VEGGGVVTHPDDEMYPSQEVLAMIAAWRFGEYPALMRFVEEQWIDCYGFFEQSTGKFEPFNGETPWKCATGGWSGNESLIDALRDNVGFWWTCWECSVRGGYYEFHVPEEAS